MTIRRSRPGRTLLAGIVLLAAGCSASGAAADPPTLIDPARDAGAGVAPVDAGRGAQLDAGQLRLLLEQLLGVHGALTVQMMRQAEQGSQTLDAWIGGLAGNTAELSGAVGVVYGPAGARAFDQLWTFHTEFFLDYADAVGRGDDEAADTALDGLADYQQDFASFIDTATAGLAPSTAVAEMLGRHVEQMIGQLDAARSGEYDEMLRLEADGHDYLATIGASLAGAFAAQQPVAFPETADEAWVEYCSIAGSALTSFVDGVTTAAALDGEVEPWRTALSTLAEVRSTAPGVVSDPFDETGTDSLVELLLDQRGSSPPELVSDANDLATLGLRLAAIDADPAATPAAIRSAYAAAYRLAQHRPPS